jgi:hypothetical protein
MLSLRRPRALIARLLGVSVALALAAVIGSGAFTSGASAAAAKSQSGAATWSALTPIGSSLRLAAVSCPTSRFCAIASDGDAKNDAGTMYTVGGTGLSKPTVISKYDGSPDSVSCPTSRFCVAIDDGGSVYTFNGTKWSTPTEIDAIPPANQTAVSCASSTFCAAIDDSGNVETFNGTGWAKSLEIDDSGGGYSAQNCSSNQEGTCAAPAAISCPSSNFCAAVDGTGSVFTYNGSSWSAATVVDGQTPIVALSCAPGSSFCVAIDASGNAFTFNGTSWSAPALVGKPGLDSVSCASSSSCVAVDDSGDALTFNGTSWSAPALVAKSALAAVSCASSSFCVAVNPHSDVLALGTASGFPQALVKFRVSTARVSSNGTLSIPISCPSGPRNCSEPVGLSLDLPTDHKAIASVNVNLVAGKSGKLKLKFSKARLDYVEEVAGHRFLVSATAAGGSVAKLTLVIS